ncbi:hypothetical protein predicted by Glimmer/Critica [Sorangium cellulosum So ce56]|uniref:PE-PGRS family protein n=1 Tax=Sorangium cellulosum (strain So ce56) TaxID=448385 RepID=A9FQ12_SORC5|nr:hypothetical protein [Sorangium cellulosum]CAN92111.1 hypothetical protein predicted by Glimmer/Critica [Sorangium cellulosum So ce56]
MPARLRHVASILALVLSMPTGCGNTVTRAPAGSGGAGGQGTGAAGTSGEGTGASAGSGGAGGEGTGAAGTGGQGTGATGAGGAAGANSGDCHTDANCPGSTCVDITPGGFRVCKTNYPPAETCARPDFDECCTTEDCGPGSTCLAAPLLPYCGGPPPLENNVCAKDLCSSDDECPGGLCAPAGTLNNKVRACVSARCRLDADCDAEPGGICATVRDPCCNQPEGLFCVYPGSGCRSSSDCGQGEYCGRDAGGAARCIVGDVVCPA